MNEPTGKPATYEDLCALPPNVMGEILDGVLYTQPRGQRCPQAHAVSVLIRRLYRPFYREIDGPGGWWVYFKCPFELPGSPEVVPRLVGWRRERLPHLPSDESIKVVPDWVAEVLSPATRDYNLRIKRPFYAKHGIPWMWIVDPETRVLVASRLEHGRWFEVGTWREDDRARIAPFDAIELDLSDLWFPPKD
ncbi:Uma2 family endonuclease [Polyangium spumosum]|uniref:Uma2 family endonuclease n=2 Tax=Polyangium spumosum TaxID=889282 RepID=A0A6N7PVE7_9BACT|nr:Uma2 family endonuclease [Polyangium spumosum]